MSAVTKPLLLRQEWKQKGGGATDIAQTSAV